MDSLFIINNEVTKRSLLPVFETLKKNIKCYILSDDYSMNNLYSYSESFIEARDALKKNWFYVFHSDPVEKAIFKGLRVSLPHGAMFGNNSWTLRMFQGSDLYFGISPPELRYIRSHLGNNFPVKKFFAAGNPAHDKIYDELLKRKKKIIEPVEANREKTILISSHWTSSGNFRKYGSGLIDALRFTFPRCKILVDCHPKIFENPKNEFRINRFFSTPNFNADWLLSYFKSIENENIKIIKEKEDRWSAMGKADVFIGDCSSMVAEAARFKIPLIIQKDIKYFDSRIQKIVQADTYGFDSIEDLVAIVDAVLFNNDRDDTGQYIRKLFSYNIGGVVTTVSDYLLRKTG